MSWSEAFAWSVLRSLLIAFSGTAIAVSIHRFLKGLQGHRKAWGWGALLLPFFVPSLMTGYCYRDTAMALVHTPWLREILYALIVAMQIVPLGVVLLAFSPTPATSESSLHQGQLFLIKRSEQLKLLLSSKYQFWIATFCLLFLLSFQESDLAALMQASGWTEWMFTKQVGGLALSRTIELTIWPVLIQIPFLIPVVLWFGKEQQIKTSHTLRTSSCHRLTQCLVILWIASSILLVFLLPTIQLVRGSMIGVASLFQQPSISQELSDAFLLATTSAGIALSLALLFFSKRIHNKTNATRSIVLFLLLLPGSLGSLALGLLLAGIFQTDLLKFAYDTPVPLILGEVGILLPRTLILFYCLGRLQNDSSKHFVSLLKTSNAPQQRSAANELRWQITVRRQFIVLVVVWFWAYFEVMLPSILAMPGLAPIGFVLYNNLHYGRIAALGAKLLLMLFAPLALIFVMLLFRRKLTSKF